MCWEVLAVVAGVTRGLVDFHRTDPAFCLRVLCGWLISLVSRPGFERRPTTTSAPHPASGAATAGPHRGPLRAPLRHTEARSGDDNAPPCHQRANSDSCSPRQRACSAAWRRRSVGTLPSSSDTTGSWRIPHGVGLAVTHASNVSPPSQRNGTRPQRRPRGRPVPLCLFRRPCYPRRAPRAQGPCEAHVERATVAGHHPRVQCVLRRPLRRGALHHHAAHVPQGTRAG